MLRAIGTPALVILATALAVAACSAEATSGDTDGNGGNVGKSGSGNPGSSGTTGTPGSSGSGSGTGGSGSGPGPVGEPGNGYVVFGSWHGYGWSSATGEGSTIEPADFSTLGANEPLCVSGTVGPAYESVAMLGVNLNQAGGEDPPLFEVTPTGSGIIVNYTNPGGSDLRIQIQGKNGETDENDRWCATLPASGTEVKFTSFNTKCWDDSGDFYTMGTPIVAAALLVPGALTATNFNFCLNSLEEVGGGGGGGGAGNTSGSGTLTGQYESKHVKRDGMDYIVQNNVWGSGASQKVKYEGTSFEIIEQTGNNSGQPAPVSYPSAFIGANNNRETVGSGLPKQVSALDVDTYWKVSGPGTVSGDYNAAYDVWFSSSAATASENSPSGGFLMVWFHRPTNSRPIGTGGVNVTIEGKSFEVWRGKNGAVPCISYVSTTGIAEWEFNLKPFVQDALTRNDCAGSPCMSNSWYLTNVFAGFEIWSGGVGLKTEDFWVKVN